MMENADYIIIGGGSAGCVLAARLSENPNANILLLEAGGEGRDFLINMPAGTAKLMGHAKYDWRLPTEADPSIAHRSIQWSAGKALGGSSAINGQVYMRGERSDYDQWAAIGCDGWDFDSIFPYFLRAESFQGPASQSHGTHGPLSVSPVRDPHRISNHVLDAFLQSGIAENLDYCDGNQAGVYRIFTTQKDGQRHSAARAYIEPIRSRPNLRVVTGAHVERVRITNGRAVSVIWQRNGQSYESHARAEIIVSAGTMHSPTLLMRSGIGPAEQLRKHRIAVERDLGGVGQNLREHNSVSISKLVNIPTMSASLGPLNLARHLVQYALFRKGLLTTPAVQLMAALRTDPSLASPDIIFSMLPVAVGFNESGGTTVERRSSFSMGFHVARPQSRGAVRLRSADAQDKPIIDHRLFSDQGDLDKLVAACKLVEKICEAPALANIITAPLRPAQMPQDDGEWAAYVTNNASIGYHPIGTCRMGRADDPMAVVDPALRVHGIAGLRVVDASIMPEPVSGNTNAPTIMIAEKASEIIKETWNAPYLHH